MSKPLKWIYLAHLGYNMWLEPEVDRFGIHGQQGWSEHIAASSHLRFEEDYWQELTVQLKDAGCNTILLDLGEGLCYESHPELAVEGSWSKWKSSAGSSAVCALRALRCSPSSTSLPPTISG